MGTKIKADNLCVCFSEVTVTFVAGSGILGAGFSWVEDASAALAVYHGQEDIFDESHRLMRYVG